MNKKIVSSTPTMANLNRMTYLMQISEITPQLFISGQMAATVEQVQKLGITYIINVAIESAHIIYPKPIKMEKFDIIDFPTAPISNYFNSLTDKIHVHLNANKQNKVLVHCMAGISRSTTIVCAYLMRYMNMTLREAYSLCKKGRPICFPNLGFWNQLISYEFQLKKENSVKIIPTQYGSIPDMAFEEIKLLRAQQQQQQPIGAMPLSTTSPFASTNSNSMNVNATTNDTNFNSMRPNFRDLSISNTNGVVRSRSLAGNPVNRPTIIPSSSNMNNALEQATLFPISKQTLQMPIRTGLNRLQSNNVSNNNNSTLPPVPSTSSASFASNKSLPISTAPNIKSRNINHGTRRIPVVTVSSTTVNNDSQSPYYETTYRASFIKPLAP